MEIVNPKSKIGNRQGDEVYYLHGDHLGSTSLTTDNAGVVVSEVRYHPYGLERWTAGESPTDFGFTSQRNEKSFGLMDYNARYYSPVLGRFVSPDTLIPNPDDGQQFNRYAYTINNPLKYTDPSGHSFRPVCVLCKVNIDVSDWPDWAKKAGGLVVSVAAGGGGYDSEQDAIVGPSAAEEFESGMMNMFPAPIVGGVVKQVTKASAKGLSFWIEHFIAQAEGRRMIRGTPTFGNTWRNKIKAILDDIPTGSRLFVHQDELGEVKGLMQIADEPVQGGGLYIEWIEALGGSERPGLNLIKQAVRESQTHSTGEIHLIAKGEKATEWYRTLNPTSESGGYFYWSAEDAAKLLD